MSIRIFKSFHITILLLFTFFVGSWFVINGTSLSYNEHIRNLFTDSYWVIPMLGGVSGLLASRQWGGRSTTMGNFLMFVSSGLVLQATGQIIYAIYYLFLRIEVPYPSLGDVAYLSSVFAYIISTIYLAKVLGVPSLLRKNPLRMLFLFFPILILAISVKLFIWDYDWTDWSFFRLVMDFGQPLMQVVYISITFLTLILCWKKLGGVMKGALIFVFVAFFFQYISDFYYAYRATYGGWKPAYFSDLMYVVTYLTMSQAIYMFSEGYHNLVKKRS